MKEILITSSVLIVALLVIRLIFAKKVSRRLIYGAWIVVALRLLIPVQIGQMDLSVLTATRSVTQAMEQVATRPVSGPTQQEVYKDIVLDYLEKDQTVFVPEVQAQIREETEQGAVDREKIADKIQQKYPQQEIFIPEVQEQVRQQVAQGVTAPTLGQLALMVWLAGVGVMAVWLLLVNLRYSRMLRKETRILDCRSPIPVLLSERVTSPCLVGLLRPRVYLTPASTAEPRKLRHVLTHELTHYAHKDHIWSLLRCICLCLYWFDPLVWVAAYISRRDCELACDEGAMKRLGEEERIPYGKTLLEVVSHAATSGRLLQTATSMNETKRQLKERVNFIVKKQKMSMIAVLCMLLVCAIVTGCVAAGPTDGKKNMEQNPSTTTQPFNPPTTTGIPEPTDPQPTDPEPTDPQPTDPEPTDPQPTDPEPTDPHPTDPAPTDPEPTDPQPTNPEPTDPEPEPEPEPTISAADKELYERAIAALDAYAGGTQAYYYDDNGQYYDQDALWQICALLIRLEDYGDSAAYLRNFDIKDLKVGEVWKISTGNSEHSYKTVENNKFTYNEAGLLTGMYAVAQYGNLYFTAYTDLIFFYADGRLDYYQILDEDYALATVTCVYDGNGHLAEEKITGIYEFSVYYTYDAAGRLSGWNYVLDQGSSSETIMEYVYDAQGRLIQTKWSHYVADYMFPEVVELVQTQVADYIYDEKGLLSSVSTDIFAWWNGEEVSDVINETTTFTYDSQGRVLSQYHKTGPMTDLEGNVLDDITVHWEEVTYSYETAIYYLP